MVKREEKVEDRREAEKQTRSDEKVVVAVPRRGSFSSDLLECRTTHTAVLTFASALLSLSLRTASEETVPAAAAAAASRRDFPSSRSVSRVLARVSNRRAEVRPLPLLLL